MDISFVILCYKTLNEVIECVKNIKKLEKEKNSISIIIVDNFSNDGTYEELLNIYKNDDFIEVVCTEYNVGFAKGNNLGYSIAKYKFNSDFIVCLNSDVYIKDELFLKKLINNYHKYNFDIAGPSILTVDGNYQNPVKSLINDYKKIYKYILINRIRFIKTYIPIINNVRGEFSKNDRINKDLEGVCLHGACIIFSERYIRKFSFAFFPETFLYAEEDILFFLAKRFNLRLYYLNSIEVMHLEDSSLNTISIDNNKKKRFVLKHSYNSIKVLKRLLKEESGESI